MNNALTSDFNRLLDDCLVERTNRDAWQTGWMRYFARDRRRLRFVISADPHQPGWFDQSVARSAAAEPGVGDTVLTALMTAR